MADRPKVSADISRALFYETGNKCAVCGEPGPLELAHIVPFHKVKEHKQENMICLCANCHRRADSEGWDAKLLRMYKKRPWVRNRRGDRYVMGREAKIRLTLDLELRQYNEIQERLVVNELVRFLGLSPGSISIISIEEGSVHLGIELPSDSASQLLEAYRKRSPEMLELVRRLRILDVSEALVSTSRRRGRRSFELRHEAGVSIINVNSPLTIGDVRLREIVKELVDSGARDILIDLSGVDRMDSGGVGELISSLFSVEKAGARIRLFDVPRDVEKIILMTRLLREFEGSTIADESDLSG